MATYSNSGKSNRRGLRVTLFMLIALFGAVALVFGLVLNKKTDYSIATPETNVVFEEVGNTSLLSGAGWNNDVAEQLYFALSSVGDNVALGNANAVMTNKLISLGGYTWSVVYKQKGIITLYAHEAVKTFNMAGKSAEYANSEVRDYLNNEFYNELISKVGFAGFADLIVPFGVNEIYYQQSGAQGVLIDTLSGEKILNNDLSSGDKIWLPSAYEVGGFANTKTSPKARVNSFKTISSNGISVNSGLWNLSNASRMVVDNSLLRSNANDKVSILSGGVVEAGKSNGTYVLRPCFNIMLPEMVNGEVVSASESGYVDVNTLYAGVTPDFSAQLRKYTQETTGAVFTPKKNTTVVYEGATLTCSQALLLELSDAVNAGQDMSGKTFNLVEDVDMSDITVWNPIGRKNFVFAGTFNGNGYKISGLCSAGSGFVGLFGYLSGSSAKVYQVGVTGASWYTSNNEIGAIAGVIANGATIEQCYSDCGISGGNYVGGLVGNGVSTSNIKNCYNLNGVAGVNYVGGIIGSNTATKITNSYNAGAVSATTNDNAMVGGLFGQSLSGASYTACVYNSQNASASSNGNIKAAKYTEMQGLKTKASIVAPTAMSGWAFSGAPWTISASLNDRLPMLKVFIKNATVNLRAGDGINQVAYSVNGSTPSYGSSVSYTHTSGASSSATITIYAKAQFTGSNHYAFSGWNHYGVSTGGLVVPSDNQFIAGSGCTSTASATFYTYTLSLTLDDSYNLVAEFEKLYSLTVSPVFNGFASASEVKSGELTISNNGATPFVNNGVNWYKAGDTVTVSIGTPNGRSWKFAGLTGSTNGSTFSNVTASTAANSFIQAQNVNAGPFTVTVGHATGYAASDSYTLRPNFDRYYTITIANAIPAISGAPTIVTQMVLSAPSKTVKSSDATLSAELKYNGTINTSIVTAASTYSNYYTFKSWELLHGTTALTTLNNASNTGTAIASQADSVISLTMRANFNKAEKTVSISEVVGGTANSEAGIYTLSQNANLSAVSADSGDIKVEYGTTVYLYILPNFAKGYTFKSFSLASAASTQVVVGEGIIRFNFAVVETKTHTVEYELASKFNITFAAKLDGASDVSTFTFNPTSYSNIAINANIGAAVVTCEAGKYFLQKVKVTYGSGATAVTGETLSNGRPSGGYEGASSYNLFSTNQTVATLLSAIGANAKYNTYNITVTAEFIGILRTISVTEVWNGKNPDGSNTRLSHATSYTIMDTTLNPDKVVTGQGIYGNTHVVTANPGQGYKVVSIALLAGGANHAATQGESGTVFVNHVKTAEFVLNTNLNQTLSITITYEAKSLKLTVTDNMATIGVPSTNQNKYNITIGGTTLSNKPSGTASYVNIGGSAKVTGFNATATISENVTMAQISKVEVLKDGVVSETITTLGTEWSIAYPESSTFSEIELRLTYIVLRNITITLTDATLETDAKHALVILKDVDKVQPNIVVLVDKGNVAPVSKYCVDNTTYEVESIVPVYVDSTDDSTKQITVSTTSSAVTVKLEQDLKNASVFGSAIFQ